MLKQSPVATGSEEWTWTASYPADLIKRAGFGQVVHLAGADGQALLGGR